MTATRLTLLAALTAGAIAAPLRAQSDRTARTTVDHVILGIADLDVGIAELERRTGVRPVIGGVHPGRGTRNALLSLGDGTYLELMALSDEPADNPTVAHLRTLDRLTPIGWAIGTPDLAATTARLRAAGVTVSDPLDGSRRRPDGSVLAWRTAELDGAGTALAPFLIEWRAGSAHPSSTSPAGCRLEALDLDGLPATLRTALRDSLRLPLRAGDGAPAMRLRLRCPKGTVTFTP